MTTTGGSFLDADGFPIVDRLLARALEDLVTLPDQTIKWGTVIDPNGHLPAGRVVRLPGGGRDADGYEDVSRIEVLTLGLTRSESDAMTGQVRRVMAELSDDEYAGVGLDRIREDSGPGRIPDPNEDVRAVPTTWAVTARCQQ